MIKMYNVTRYKPNIYIYIHTETYKSSELHIYRYICIKEKKTSTKRDIFLITTL